MTTQGELPDIVERLRHPAWVHSKQPFTSPVLDQETCVFDMLAAADEIERLRSTPPGSPLERDDEDRMWKISKLIADLQSVLDRFGDTCVYIRRGGLSWGAVALNRCNDDKKHGIFDLQVQHDRDMLERLGQIDRLKKDRDEWRQKVWDAEASTPFPSPTEREGE